MASLAADAAGLGKMNVSSALGEPLRAEIELLSVSTEELSSLSAAIAPDTAYSAQGVERTAFHSSIKIELAKKADGTHVLKLSTSQPVSDPYLDMLIQVDWNSGRLIREYTALLDPPGYSSNNNVPNAEAPESRRSMGNVNSGQDVLVDIPARQGRKSDRRQTSPARSLSGSSAGDEYKVKRGDTLLGIARQKPVENVSLDQMLVGLYRANTNAFIGGNINRLKVGQIIRIPAGVELGAIDRHEASKEVQVQVANWNAYRNKLAEVVAGSEALGAEVSKKTASGRITKPAEELVRPLVSGSRDVVKLSKGDVVTGKRTSEATVQAQQNALQEEAVANDGRIKEANERIAALTKQLEDMQKLLELKGQAMADLQKLAEKSMTESKKSMSQANPQPTAVAVLEPQAKTASSQPEVPALKASDKPLKTIRPDVSVKASASPPAAAGGIVDSLMENVVLLGAAGAALVLSVGGWLFLRNRRMHSLDKFEQDILTTGGLNAKTVFGSTAGGTVDTGDTSFLTAFTHGTGGMIDTHDVDPLAEAEVYMAYGREIQAEEILKDAIAKEPKRHDLSLKLLEIYAGRKDSLAFDAVAGELYSTLGAGDPVWLKIAEIGHEMEPDNPLYQR
ncbi:MAG: FimV/HubP family polar landmark protein, partial [Methylophilaceae bacterium]